MATVSCRVAVVLVTLLTLQVALGEEPPSAPQAEKSGEVLTLDQAVTLALRNNRPFKIAVLEVEKSGEEVAVAKTRRLPSTSFYLLGSQLLTKINFQFKEGVFGTFPGIGPVPGRDTDITTPRRPNAYVVGQVAQPLSQLYKISLGIRQQELSQEVNREKLREQRQQLVSDVKRAYYNILQTESQLAATEESLRSLRELDRVVLQYVSQKAALRSESLEVKTRLAQTEYTAIKLRHTLATQKEYLNVVLARDIRTDFRSSGMPEATLAETDLRAAQAKALSQRPELRQAGLSVRQAEYARRLKKAEYIPDVSLSLQYISPFRIEVLPQNVTALGFQLSWEPFDWGRKKHELNEQTMTITQAQASLTEAQNKVLIDVNDRFRKLEEARTFLAVTRATQEAAREKLRVTTNRFQQSAALLKDMLQQQSDVADADNRYQQALLSFWTAKADFEKALGED